MKNAPHAEHRNQVEEPEKFFSAPNADATYAVLKVVVTPTLDPKVYPHITDFTGRRKLTLNKEDLNTASVDKKRSLAKAMIMKIVLQVIANTSGVAIA